MVERLQGLDEVEQTACLIAERALGATATANDVPPRQGAVEAFLDYPDGRRGAFEVTQLATDGGASLQLQSLLSRDGFGWPLAGKWWWTIEIGHPRDLPRLRNIFDKIVLLCESVGVTDPRYLALGEVDADVQWLVEESSVQMHSHPNVPATNDHRPRRATINQRSTWGGSDETFSLLDEELSAAFEITHIQDHVAKLRRTQADERHLFLVVGVYDWHFSLFDAVSSGARLPAGAPALPEGLTHLWLAPEYCWRVLIGTSAGWAETRDIRSSLAAEAGPPSPLNAGGSQDSGRNHPSKIKS
jgi:hypothetical protein